MGGGAIPLLDEVTELLQRERTLLGLKVLEHQVEAQDWRSKYEALVEKVADVAGRTENARVFEMAADVHSTPIKAQDFRYRVMEALRAKEVNWILDLCDTNVGLAGISEVLKIFHGLKSSSKISVILLRNTSLDGSCNEQTAAICSFPFFDGLDISWNNLTKSFIGHLITALEVLVFVHCINFTLFVTYADPGSPTSSTIFTLALQSGTLQYVNNENSSSTF